MSKIDEIRSEMVAAMKAGDKERKAALSFLLSSLKNKAIDKRADLTEEEEGQVILKEIKQLKETLEMTPADRTDLIEETQKRLSVLEEYAPKMMDADEIKAVIQTVLSELGIETPTAKEKGKIMNILSSNSKPNRDIRLAVADEGFYLWQLAAELGITDGTLSKKLRRELSENEKQDCFAAIERMKKARQKPDRA